ncbi:MAG: efflux RND transporter periplasmic adaptor subunit [Candidatus Thiodiazotropha sp.]
MLKRLFLTLLGLAVLIGLPALIKMQQFQAMAQMQMQMPPETVTATQVRSERWADTVTATGTLVAVQGVTVSAELGGKITKIAFESGDRVKAGDLLVRLDTTAEEAQLRSAEAAAKLARINLDRNRDLRKNRTISQADLDTAEANFKQATAQVDNVRATIDKKTITAPFAGLLGLRQVNLGQIVEQGTPVVTLQTLDPIYVDFSLPQQRYASLSVGSTVQITTDAAPEEVFEGRILAVNPEIDTLTRSVRIRAVMANRGEHLRAGMFANVEVVLPKEEDYLIIPSTAVLYAPYGDTVFVIDTQKDETTGEEQQILRQQIVRLGRTKGDFVAVSEGLKAGEMIVTSRVFKLRPKSAVVIDNSLALDAKLNPDPANQ